jgi:hypothetical protein
MGDTMRRAPAVALAIVLPTALLVAGSASASPVMPVPSALVASLAGAHHGGAHSSAAGIGSDQAVVPGVATLSRTRGGLPKIHGFVSGDRVITVEPRTVPAGEYKVIVNDTVRRHNWHIFGPGGINKETGVKRIEKKTWILTFVAGTYQVVCDPHVEDMNTTLQVT